ncbi:Crp/Fnr family transcriptional regulator [Rhizobium azibense]|uniref:CRP-like cAMP-binding protein n=1 Tax=Rhizobium azibense TaxID=1136135 RepID=A0A4R3S122_9HYPH|nr:Crp/Fnr family transcriptional regulator [Rhizobium azibense]TCU37906.1 CRP-like cAMP-binding protein [Rhizobium azibense]
MPAFSQATVSNRLLKALAPEAFERLRPEMTAIDLGLKYVVVEANEPTLQVCFIESGLASMVAVSSDDEAVEVGHVGREGLGGHHVLLMTETTPNRTFMQVAGTGIAVPIEHFLSIVDDHKPTRDLLLRYVHSASLQLAHSALANARYSMQERLARWLLMCHDRLEGDNLALTHEFLGMMLGVRRAGVTNELHILEGVHAIKSTRGNVKILDRQKLQDIAGGCYGLPEAEYERLIGIPMSHMHRGLRIASSN